MRVSGPRPLRGARLSGRFLLGRGSAYSEQTHRLFGLAVHVGSTGIISSRRDLRRTALWVDQGGRYPRFDRIIGIEGTLSACKTLNRIVLAEGSDNPRA